MATRMRDLMERARDQLRWEPTEKRIRAWLGSAPIGAPVVDSTRALLVWEPRRVVPGYAVPEADLSAELRPAPLPPPAGPTPNLLHPGIPFAVRLTPGQPLTVSAGAQTRAAAFRPGAGVAGPDLAGYVLLDFNAFDAWAEEDEPVVVHPRDPYARIDIRRSSRHVRVEHGGQLVAESRRPVLLFETDLPVRFYLPRQDVVAAAEPSPKRTRCPYKGEASYWSITLPGGRRLDDLAWTYLQPLPEAFAIAGLVAFYDEKFDVTVDGRRRSPPASAESAALLDEAGL